MCEICDDIKVFDYVLVLIVVSMFYVIIKIIKIPKDILSKTVTEKYHEIHGCMIYLVYLLFPCESKIQKLYILIFWPLLLF